MFKQLYSKCKDVILKAFPASAYGKTAAQAAREHHISLRTVERYGYPRDRKINQRQDRKRAKWN